LSDIEIARRSTRGSLILFGGNFLSTGILAVSSVVIARLLGPDAYGAYTLALLLPNILVGFVGLGVGVGVTRFSAHHLSLGEEAIARRMTNNATIFLLLFGLLLTFVSYFGAGFVASEVLKRPDLTYLSELASLTVFSQGLIQSVTSSLLGHNAVRTISVVNVLQASLRLIVGTALVLFGMGALGALLGLIASYYAAGGFALFALYGVVLGTKGLGLGLFFSDNATMLRYGFPHLAGSLISSFSLQYVTIIVAIVASNAVVGYYQSAQNVLAAVNLTSAALTLTLLPAFAHLQGISADTALAFRYAVKYTSFVIGPIIFFTIGASAPIVQVLYGASFTSADSYLILLSISISPILLGHAIFPAFFSGVGKTRLSMYFYLVGAAFQFALAPIFGLWLGLGVPGLIYSSLVGNLTSTALGLFFARKFFDATIDARSLGATVLALSISFATLLPFQLVKLDPTLLLIIDISAFLVVYLTAAPLMGAMTADDVTRLRMATAGMGYFSRAFGIVLRYESKVLRARSPQH
jgi:O-antigen/teichoic acid export membrane protein